jgi:hypothetical protein
MELRSNQLMVKKGLLRNYSGFGGPRRTNSDLGGFVAGREGTLQGDRRKAGGLAKS